MHTEENAKSLWCPMSRAPRYMKTSTGENIPVVVNQPGHEGNGRCVAGRCAMWRWFDITGARRRGIMSTGSYLTSEPLDERKARKVPDSWEWVLDPDECVQSWFEPESDALARRTGYCGLAGKPGLVA